ncbi:RNA recognition domain-containing protein [Scedosporium apiospermum]|uniref:RNA recognition domain-containing protein n=1 Tax=Pseudallescheria apiosperma TaxID=563466 RepID=A0A084GGQ3_PSEDA|nr:RNA recognition domain-containing protein [Scedosporium apiospermum]KEZ46515.1 RNA recognition domain-containing protein [Scedosporium apiospermum]
MTPSGPPIATIYVNNLEERVKIETLKEALSQVFSEYGNVIEIVAKANLRAKGQAFIVFDDPAVAQEAIEELQGFQLFEKPMRLALARTRSDATVRGLCSDEDFEQHKRRRVAEKDKRRALEAADEQKRLKRVAPSQDLTSRPARLTRGAGLKSSNPPSNTLVPDEYLPPNKTLFVQNIPEDYDVDSLTSIFGRFDGFREVRLVPGRKGIAFVEYEAEHGAITAKENTAGMALGESGQAMKVTYQRQ